MDDLTASPSVTPIGSGAYRVEHAGRVAVVYVAGTPQNLWAFSSGEVFRAREEPVRQGRVAGGVTGPQSLTAPMPGTVVRLLLGPGAKVAKGDPILILEAMKMELPIRAPADGVVSAVHCREGQLVQAETDLVEFTSGEPAGPGKVASAIE